MADLRACEGKDVQGLLCSLVAWTAVMAKDDLHDMIYGGGGDKERVVTYYQVKSVLVMATRKRLTTEVCTGYDSV